MNREETSANDGEYTRRLVRLQTARWKRWLDVQRPYRMHLRALEPGFVLEVGCGIGRNLGHLAGRAVGVDVDVDSVRHARDVLGYEAYTPAEFAASDRAADGTFDSLLFSHVLEHVDSATATALVRDHLRYLRKGGRVIVITPQELGYASDETHVRFVDHAACEELARALGLRVEKAYSFPFPRIAGRVFKYNEFVTILRAP